jgi:hypothetical protein
MTTQNLPGTDAARHGAGDADLTIMLAAHDAFRRDLARLVRAAAVADMSDPARRQSVAAGWELFKYELHLHHTAEDEVIWPVLRPRLAHSEHALSVLDEMEEEHERIDPLLAAVDAGFARRGEDSADRRGPDRCRMARCRLQDRTQERPVRGRRDVRLDARRRQWRHCRHPARAAPAAAPALQGRLEAPLQQNPALVTPADTDASCGGPSPPPATTAM